jgi:hypothetical protein
MEGMITLFWDMTLCSLVECYQISEEPEPVTFTLLLIVMYLTTRNGGTVITVSYVGMISIKQVGYMWSLLCSELLSVT